MASRFVVAVALFAVCQSSPVLNGVREKRFTNTALAENISYGGNSKATAQISGLNVMAASNTDDRGNLARDGLGYSYPGRNTVKVTQTDSSNVDSKYLPAYYSAPAPASVVTYTQSFEQPREASYLNPAASAIAQSNANVGYSNSNAQAQINDPTIIAAKTQGYNSAYTTNAGSAISNAHVNGQYGSAASYAKTAPVPARKSISWRFGTAYDHPAAYVRSAPTHGSAITDAKTVGSGSAQANANVDLGTASANTNTYGGSAKADAGVNSRVHSVLRSGETSGPRYASANSIGHGSAASIANGEQVKSYANSIGSGSSNSFARQTYFNTLGSAPYEVADSRANTLAAGWGSSAAHAQSG